MTQLSMSADEIRRRHREGATIQILADLNGCGMGIIRAIVGEETKPSKEKTEAPKKRRYHLDREKVRELYDSGLNDREIAERVGSSAPSICMWRHSESLPPKCDKKEVARRAGKASAAKNRKREVSTVTDFTEQTQAEKEYFQKVETGPIAESEGIVSGMLPDAKQSYKDAVQDAAKFVEEEPFPEVVLREPNVYSLDRDLKDLRHNVECARSTCIGMDNPHALKPPLGVLPRKLWEELRADEICRAIIEYASARIPIPEEWIEEFNERVAKV